MLKVVNRLCPANIKFLQNFNQTNIPFLPLARLVLYNPEVSYFSLTILIACMLAQSLRETHEKHASHLHF